MRRGIAATALVAGLALAATACGGGDSSDRADGPVTVTWWDTSNATKEAPTYQALIKDSRRPTRTSRSSMSTCRSTTPRTSSRPRPAATGAPDVMRTEVGWIADFAKLGYLAAARRHRRPRRPDDFLPQPVKQPSTRARPTASPCHRHPRPVLQQEAPQEGRRRGPQTLDELKTAAATIKAKTGADGYWGATQAYCVLPFLYGEGSDMVDADAKKITSTRAGVKKALRTWQSLFAAKGRSSRRHRRAYANIQDAFINGKVAMIVHGPWDITNIDKGAAFKDKANLGIAPVPAGCTAKAAPRPAAGTSPSTRARKNQRPPTVREVHELGEGPGADREEELNRCPPATPPTRRGQGRPGHRRLPGGSRQPPSRDRRSRVQLPAGSARHRAAEIAGGKESLNKGLEQRRDRHRQAGAGLHASDARVAAGSPGHGGGNRGPPACARRARAGRHGDRRRRLPEAVEP